MEDRRKVVAVVVTRDRLELLKLALQKLESQTYPVKKIVVVNNASTDGTTEYLKTLTHKPQYSIINLKRNTGGAGGFYYGIKRAYQLGCDHIWIMDDDTLADEKALAYLMESLELLKEKNVGFVSSNVLYKDGTPCLMNVSKTVKRWNDFIEDGIVEIAHSSFVGMLIPARVVEAVGLPIKDYFIWGDDAEYSTRILRKGYSGYSVGKSRVWHYMNENVGVDIFSTPKERIGRFYYFYRNVTITDRMKGCIPFVLRLGYHGFIAMKILFSHTDHKLLKSSMVIRGTAAGMFKQVRIDKVDSKRS